MIGCLVWMVLGGAMAQEEEPLYLARVGITLDRPSDWTVPRWSDWDLDARDAKRTVQLHVESSLYQLPVTDENTRAWAEKLAFGWLEEHQKGSELEIREVSSFERDGRAHGLAEISYRYQGKNDAVAYQETFATEGRMVHILTTAVKRNQKRARAALDAWVPRIEVEKPAGDLSALKDRAQAAGFGSELPDGWRLPLRTEFLEAVQLASQLGQKRVTEEDCWMGISPKPGGETRMLLACAMEFYLGVVDEHSFDAVDARIRGSIFRGFGEALGSGESVALPLDRSSALYRLPAGGETAIWVAVTPYAGGVVLTYAVGTPEDDAVLRGAIESSLETMAMEGPDNGAHPATLGDKLMYYLNHRRTHPVVWGPIVLLVLGGGLLLRAGGARTSYKDLVE